MLLSHHDFTILVNQTCCLDQTYLPPDLVSAEIPFEAEPEDPKRLLRAEAALAVKRLFQRAQADGLHLYGISGYRSYQRQKELFSQSTSGYVAAPGASEHQTGLALDVSCPSVYLELSEQFSESPEGKWLADYASLYGFILRYPKGKESITGCPYEPWHFRYVTAPLASYLTLTGQTLEEYHALSDLF